MGSFIVHQLACVLLQVDPVDADHLVLPVHPDVHMAVQTHGTWHLGDLVRLGQIRVEIVLSVEFAVLVDLAVHGIACLDDVFHRLPVQNGQGTGQSGAYRTAAGIGLAAEFRRTGAEHLGFGQKLGVDLQADGGVQSHFAAPPSGFAGITVKPCSNASAAWMMVASSKRLPIKDMPMGIPVLL